MTPEFVWKFDEFQRECDAIEKVQAVSTLLGGGCHGWAGFKACYPVQLLIQQVVPDRGDCPLITSRQQDHHLAVFVQGVDEMVGNRRIRSKMFSAKGLCIMEYSVTFSHHSPRFHSKTPARRFISRFLWSNFLISSSSIRTPLLLLISSATCIRFLGECIYPSRAKFVNTRADPALLSVIHTGLADYAVGEWVL